MEEKLTFILDPLLRCSVPISEQRMLLHQMFTATVCNAPDDESDNFTAKQISPFYLALCETLEKLETIKDKKSQ